MSIPAPSADSTALVTGASSGIGMELARQLAARGHGVTLVARRAEALATLAEELSTGGVRVEVMPTDLSSPQERAGIPDRLDALGLTVGLLVNNAGLSTVGPVHRSDPAAELNMIEVDVAAVVDLCSRFLPGMVERGRGAVLNVASTAAFQPLPGQAGYAACKAFVVSYTRALRGELRGTGVSATALCPGPVDTGFGEAAGFSRDEIEKGLPSFMWESTESVARTGLEGVDRNRAVAIPGPANRVSALVAQATPKDLLVPVLARRHPGLKD